MRQFALLAVVVAVGTLPAQTVLPNKANTIPRDGISTSYLGAGAGLISGYGFSYRRWVPDKKYGFQLTGFPFYIENKYNDAPGLYSDGKIGYSNIGMFSAGCMYLYRLYAERDVKVLLYSGGNVQADYEKSRYTEYRIAWNYGAAPHDTSITNVVIDKFHKKVSLGGGFGGELRTWRLYGTLLIGVFGYYNMETREKGILPSAEVSLLFGL